jgi:kinesin family protein C1
VIKKAPALSNASSNGTGSPAPTTRVPIKRNPSELEIAKSDIEVLRQALNDANERAQEDCALVRQLEEERSDLDAQLSHAQRQINSFEIEARERENDRRKEISAKEAALKEVALRDGTIAQLQKKLANAIEESEMSIHNANARIATITEAANHRMTEFEGYIAKQNDREQQLKRELSMRDERIRELERTLEHKSADFKKLLLDGELQRSDLHNRIQEMKGNIRVYARVRPLIPHDREYRKSRTLEHFQFPDRVDHRHLKISIPGSGKDFSFEFDKVFEPVDGQERVFDEISQLVQSALDGYKVCIFVYGQTGSGKTFTMEGNNETVGVIQRAVERIFNHSQEKKRTGWDYTLRASFVEIYNETIHDLLNPAEFSKGPGSTNVPKHEIRTVEEESFITNVEEVLVEDASTVHTLLNISQGNRKCEATLMNDRASRSHSVFTLKIRGVNEGTAQVLQGVLNLVDLAGSERVSKSGVEGDRLRETQCINKSLTCLGDVISALGKGDASHVPFRNSKLTHMLQPYMGGESKTLMFVNISPAEAHVNESLCSLRFAAKVNACEIGLAMRKVSSMPGGMLKR